MLNDQTDLYAHVTYIQALNLQAKAMLRKLKDC